MTRVGDSWISVIYIVVRYSQQIYIYRSQLKFSLHAFEMYLGEQLGDRNSWVSFYDCGIENIYEMSSSRDSSTVRLNN